MPRRRRFASLCRWAADRSVPPPPSPGTGRAGHPVRPRRRAGGIGGRPAHAGVVPGHRPARSRVRRSGPAKDAAASTPARAAAAAS